MTRLEENLSLRHTLRFKDGKFRVLTFSDLHGIENYDLRLTRDLDAIIEKVKPDLVMLLGDVGWRTAVTDAETFRAYLADVVAPIEKRKIPWAHVFGNHDDERGLLNEMQESVYESFEYCVSKAGPDDVAGTANYVLPVKSETSDDIVFNVWGLDSHDGMGDYIKEFGLKTDPWFFNLPDPLYPFSRYDSIRFNQIMWYWNSSEEINAFAGKKVPGIMAFHIPLPEFIVLYKNTAQTYYKGTRREAVGCGPFNSGLFNALVERGEVKAVICGHDHINDFEGDYCNIRLAMDGGISYDCYCDDDLRGGRVVEVKEASPDVIDTYMVRSADCVPDYPGECVRKFGDSKPTE